MIPVIDLFAGPGGLGEGFSALLDSSGCQAFKIALSIEKDPIAHQTLLLRSFFRQFPDNDKPELYYRQIRAAKVDWQALSKEFPEAAKKAEAEVWQAELGAREYPSSKVDQKIRKALAGKKNWVLIGGPPCQVYSQVGRSRIRGESKWHFARDKRHLLYKEYLRIIAVHRPPVFVMENVKGLLSSKKYGKKIIQQIIADLQNPIEASEIGEKNKKSLEYKLYALANDNDQSKNKSSADDDPAKYIIRAENHGIPQARHRLILVGIRSDIAIEPAKLTVRPEKVRMWKAIQDLPKLRSRLSRTTDSSQAWADAVQAVLTYKTLNQSAYREIRRLMHRLSSKFRHSKTGGEYVKTKDKPKWEAEWLFDDRLAGVCNHSTRSHIPEDLWRYFYAACFARLNRKSPVLDDFPSFLLPAHKNAKKGRSDDNDEAVFADRFRVQLKHRPSTTITSHISKDGHYFIHPDPLQCRSLTVREAARLQTFPDNYYFMGPRTSQYQQVGNAVPPLLAREIAQVIFDISLKMVKVGMLDP